MDDKSETGGCKKDCQKKNKQKKNIDLLHLNRFPVRFGYRYMPLIR